MTQSKRGCVFQLEDTIDEYRRAATLLWKDAGKFAVDQFERINNELFADELPPLPILIGITAYGHCTGLTRFQPEGPRITLSQTLFNKGGPLTVIDTLIHEMDHALLNLRGENAAHNGKPWCDLITELSPKVLGREITVRPVRSRRIPNPERVT
uniref:SprT-like domain-containing protein n=1 Tax=Frankia sp. Cr1 TaxID=3073931 RepID=UPI002AD271F5